MGFVDKPHRCNVPLTAHGSVAMVGAYFECDHCKATWAIQARVPDTTTESMWKLTWIRFPDTATRSWLELT